VNTGEVRVDDLTGKRIAFDVTTTAQRPAPSPARASGSSLRGVGRSRSRAFRTPTTA
jgi:hypothetical protein